MQIMMQSMSAEQQMRDAQLKALFPKMKPVRSSPLMFTLNGCGLKIYGTRDYEPQSQSYVTTLFFTILFVPIFPITAYRVIPASGDSYYFIGREPLSKLCGGIRNLLALAIVLTISLSFWNSYISSPSYQNRVVLNEAKNLLSSQQWQEATKIVLPLIDHPEKGSEALSIVQQANEGVLVSSPETVRSYVTVLGMLPNREKLMPHFADRLLDLVNKNQQENPAEAMNFLKIAMLHPGDTDPQKLKEAMLLLSESWLKKDPQNVHAACEYVIAREETIDEKQQKEILLPFIKNPFLLDSEAARILGGILFRDGRYQESVALLSRYNTPRMEKFHQSVKNYQTTLTRRQEFYINQLDQNMAPASFYQAYDKASDADKNRLVNDYLVEKFKKDPAVQQAFELQEQTGQMVAPVLQLGISQLNLSRDIERSEDRIAMLRSAESTFLSIRGAVGETDEYRLFLGEISYWLGKHDEGKKLFDELLTDKKRSAEWIMEVALRLRDVGEVDASRKLLEEAWEKEKVEKSKQSIAATLQIMAIDIKERTKWLSRCNQSLAEIKTAVHENAAHLALQEGRKSDAITSLKAALEEYKHLTESSSKLNNEALVWQLLALQTGNIDDFRASIASMERSVRLEQSSVVLTNLASAYQSLANWQINQKRFDLAKVPDFATGSHSFYLCKTSADHEKQSEEFKASPEVIQSIKLYSQVQVMAPKNADSYEVLLSFYGMSGNEKELEKLLNQVVAAQFDFTDSFKRAIDYYQGNYDEEDRVNLEKSIQQYRKLIDSSPDGVTSPTGILLEYFLISKENAMRKYNKADAIPAVAPLLERAKKLHANSACLGSLGILGSLHCEAAIEELRKDPAIDELYRRNRWMMSDEDICTLMFLEPTFLPKLATNEHLKIAYQLNQDQMKITGNEVSLMRWVWSRAFAPDQTDAFKFQIAQALTKKLITRLEYELAPYSANNILYQHILALALDDESMAKEVLEKAKARGIEIIH